MEQIRTALPEPHSAGAGVVAGNSRMTVFFTLFANEWIKQGKRGKVWAFAGIAALVTLALALLQHLLLPGQSVLAREDVLASALHLLAPLVLPLMAAVLTIDALSDEIAKGTIRSTLFLPAGRSSVYWAKALAVLAGGSVSVGVMWGMTLMAGLLLPGRDPLLSWIAADLATTFAALAPVGLVVALVMMLSQWFKSAGGILATLVIGGLATNLLPLLLKGIGPILPTTWMGFGASFHTYSLTGALSALVVLAAWTVLFSMAGWLRFEKRSF